MTLKTITELLHSVHRLLLLPESRFVWFLGGFHVAERQLRQLNTAMHEKETFQRAIEDTSHVYSIEGTEKCHMRHMRFI